MREYELLYIVPGDKSESEASAVQDSVKSMLAEHKADIKKEDNWGRRRLAYDINKQAHGWYMIVNFTVEPANTPEIERALTLNGDVVRSLIVNAADLPTEAEKAAQAERAEKYQKTPDEKPRPAARKAAPAPEKKEKDAPAKPEKPAEPQLSEAERKAKLEEKLGQILGDEDDKADNA